MYPDDYRYTTVPIRQVCPDDYRYMTVPIRQWTIAPPHGYDIAPASGASVTININLNITIVMLPAASRAPATRQDEKRAADGG